MLDSVEFGTRVITRFATLQPKFVVYYNCTTEPAPMAGTRPCQRRPLLAGAFCFITSRYPQGRSEMLRSEVRDE